MHRCLALIALAVTLTVSASAASLAATCKASITVSGNGALTQKGAEKKAVDAWRTQAISNHGVFYGDWAAANDGKGGDIKRCARSQLGLMICEVSGRPCQASAPEEKHAIACTDDDKEACVPEVKWVQKQLNEKTKSNLKVDGVPGRGTANAIRDFQKSKGLTVNGEIDETLLKALES
jgi:hypothetical protein